MARICCSTGRVQLAVVLSREMAPPEIEHTTIETATRAMRTPPEMQVKPGRSARGYVTVLLACSLGLMALVAAFNAIVDPFGTVGTGLLPTATWSDRTIKVNLIDRLKTPPQLIVLGSSRAMKIQPRFLQRKTGLPGFNGRRVGVRQPHPRPLRHYAAALLVDVRCRGAAPHHARSRPYPTTSAGALLLVEHPRAGQPPRPHLALLLGHGPDLVALPLGIPLFPKSLR